MSASAPLGRPSKNTGSVDADCTSATRIGELVGGVISQAAATSFIHMQVLAVTQVSHNMRNTGIVSGASAVIDALWPSGAASCASRIGGGRGPGGFGSRFGGGRSATHIFFDGRSAARVCFGGAALRVLGVKGGKTCPCIVQRLAAHRHTLGLHAPGTPTRVASPIRCRRLRAA